MKQESEPFEDNEAQRLGMSPEEYEARLDRARKSIAEWEAENGPITDEERATAAATWRG